MAHAGMSYSGTASFPDLSSAERTPLPYSPPYSPSYSVHTPPDRHPSSTQSPASVYSTYSHEVKYIFEPEPDVEDVFEKEGEDDVAGDDEYGDYDQYGEEAYGSFDGSRMEGMAGSASADGNKGKRKFKTFCQSNLTGVKQLDLKMKLIIAD